MEPDDKSASGFSLRATTTHLVSDWRIWLARQLRDELLTDDEVAGIVAYHPRVTDQWRKPTPATQNLRDCQRQLDMDGCEVGVSRQALDEVLDHLGVRT